METLKIEIILRALELGSLTKAAEEYDYSPPAVAQMVTSIENEIGTKLIVRTHSGIEVAEGMDDVILLLSDMVKTKNKIIKSVKEKSQGQKTVTIATYASVSKYILPNAIKEYKKKCPNVDINIIVSDTPLESFKKGLADIAFGRPIKSDEAIWEKVITDPYVAVLPLSFPVNGKSISPDELLKNKFIMPKDCNISGYMKEYTKEDFLGSNSTDDSSVIALVRAEMGVSILSSIAVSGVSDVKTTALNPPLSRELGFIYNKNDLKDKKYISDFVNFLTNYIKNFAK